MVVSWQKEEVDCRTRCDRFEITSSVHETKSVQVELRGEFVKSSIDVRIKRASAIRDSSWFGSVRRPERWLKRSVRREFWPRVVLSRVAKSSRGEISGSGSGTGVRFYTESHTHTAKNCFPGFVDAGVIIGGSCLVSVCGNGSCRILSFPVSCLDHSLRILLVAPGCFDFFILFFLRARPIMNQNKHVREF